MAFCSFLYNDNFRAENYSPRALPAGQSAFVSAPEMLDGRDWTCPPASTRIDLVATRANAPPFNAVGLVNQPAIPSAYTRMTAWVGGASPTITPIQQENFIFGGGNTVVDVQSATSREGVSIRFQTGTPSLCPALLMIGTKFRLEVFYPTGWSPPMLHPTRDDIQLSNNAHPVGRYVIQYPFETTIPFRFRSNPEELNGILKRMQRGSFLWQWRDGAPWMFCWSKRVPMWKFISPGIYDLDVDLEGYFEFDNIGSPAPGNATSAPGGGAILPGGGTNNVIGRRLAYGYQVVEHSFTDPGGPGGAVMRMTTPQGRRFDLVSNLPQTTPQRRQLVPAQVVELLDPNTQLSQVTGQTFTGPQTPVTIEAWERPMGMVLE